jgi:hypothetical protein
MYNTGMKTSEDKLQRQHIYNDLHREEINARQREYASTHKEETRAYAKKWRAEHREEILAKQREYYALHREEISAKEKAFRVANPEVVHAEYLARRELHGDEMNAKANMYHAEHKEEINARHRKNNLALKIEIFQHYGMECTCCGEKTLEFLSIDHINNDGYKHRKSLGSTGRNFYGWLKRNNYPDGFQTLCFNCNFAKGHFDVCPHQREQKEGKDG